MLPIYTLLLAYWAYRRFVRREARPEDVARGRDGGEGEAVENEAEDDGRDGVKDDEHTVVEPPTNGEPIEDGAVNGGAQENKAKDGGRPDGVKDDEQHVVQPLINMEAVGGGAVDGGAQKVHGDGIRHEEPLNMVALAPQMNITFIVSARVVVVVGVGVGAIGLGYVIYKQRCLDNSLQNTLANKRALEYQMKCLQNVVRKSLQHSRALNYKLEDLQNMVKNVLERYPLQRGLEDDVMGELLHLFSTILEHGVNIQNGVLPR